MELAEAVGVVTLNIGRRKGGPLGRELPVTIERFILAESIKRNGGFSPFVC